MTINDLFGEGSGQTERYLIVNKNSLDIIPNINNTAESLLAAIILKASSQYRGVLTDLDNNPVTDPEGNTITYDNSILFDSTRLTYYDRYLPAGIIRDVFEYVEYVPND